MTLKGSKIAGVLLISTLVFLLACWLGKDQQNAKDTGNQIVVGETVAFTSYDPLGVNDGQGFTHYSPLVYETLVRMENGKAKPGLAERWENSHNTWTFYLREGVTFSDGVPFNAEAVKLNLAKLREYCPEMISYFGGISRISAVDVMDKYTLRLTYASPYYAVLQDLSALMFGMLSPAMFAKGKNPYGNTLGDTAGTGPYLLKAADCLDGKSYTFVRNKTYKGRAISGPDTFRVMIVPEAESRVMAMESGEIDLLYGSYQITYDMFDYLKNQTDIEGVMSTHPYTTRNLLLNTKSKVLSDIRLRQAIVHGIDKVQIINTVLHGLEQKADALFPKELPYCNLDLRVYDYNPAFASSLLDEAGWVGRDPRGIRMKDGRSLSLEVIYQSDRSEDEQILMAFKGQMANLGIWVEMRGIEGMSWYKKAMAGEFDITVNNTYGFPLDPHVFVAAMIDYGVDNPAQQGLSQKPEIDRRINDILSTVAEASLQQNYAYVLHVLHNEAVNVPVSYIHERVVFNSKKIKKVTFADDKMYCDISSIILK